MVISMYLCRNKKKKEMKKKIRTTGEVVNIIVYSNIRGSDRDDTDFVYYIDSKGIEHSENRLNMCLDFEDVEEVLSTDIDWEQIRIKAAISALQGFAAAPDRANAKELALWSVCAADALIAELKKGGEK